MIVSPPLQTTESSSYVLASHEQILEHLGDGHGMSNYMLYD